MLREEEGLAFTVTIQVDTLCHKIPRFIEKAGRAGVDRVFIGLENINPEALEGSRKRQNDIAEYRVMLQAWHAVGAVTFAGYILGFPTDTPASILRDIRIIQRELPIDLLEFFVLTPLPGSQDHKEMVERGVPLEPDMNAYDSAHVTAPHARMSKEEWAGVYQQAWDAYYTPEHVETVIRRAARVGLQHEQDQVADAVVSCRAEDRGHPSSRQRPLSPHVSPRPPGRSAARASARLLRSVRVAARVQALPTGADVSELRAGASSRAPSGVAPPDAGSGDRARAHSRPRRARALHRDGRGPVCRSRRRARAGRRGAVGAPGLRNLPAGSRPRSRRALRR